MKKTTPRNGKKLEELRAKALRRGDKLAMTLRKLAVKGDPDNASVEPLLKELEQILLRLRGLSGRPDGTPADRDARQIERSSGRVGHEPPFAPKSKSRKNKRHPTSAPAIAE